MLLLLLLGCYEGYGAVSVVMHANIQCKAEACCVPGMCTVCIPALPARTSCRAASCARNGNCAAASLMHTTLECLSEQLVISPRLVWASPVATQHPCCPAAQRWRLDGKDHTGLVALRQLKTLHVKHTYNSSERQEGEFGWMVGACGHLYVPCNAARNGCLCWLFQEGSG